MADEIVVHFGKKENRKLTATVVPAGKVRGVLRLSPDQRDKLIQEFGLTRVGFSEPLPPEIKVMEGGTAVTLSDGDPGPGVCYWVGNQLICW